MMLHIAALYDIAYRAESGEWQVERRSAGKGDNQCDACADHDQKRSPDLHPDR